MTIKRHLILFVIVFFAPFFLLAQAPTGFATLAFSPFPGLSFNLCWTPIILNFSVDGETSPGPFTDTWSFGDGTGAVVSDVTTIPDSPNHFYNKPITFPQSYFVFLTRTNSSGTKISSFGLTFHDTPSLFLTVPSTVCAGNPLSVTANVTSSEPVINWNWNFDDTNDPADPGNPSGTSNQANASFTFSNAGDYVVSLNLGTSFCNAYSEINVMVLPASSCTATPVTLVDFSGYLQNSSSANLQWLVANEQNISYYLVQRSFDDKEGSWLTIDSVMAFNYNYERRYSFTDSNIPEGASTIYYKLISVENGVQTPYKVIAISKKEGMQVSVYPNPFANDFNFLISNSPTSANIQIRDIMGHVLLKKENVSGDVTINTNFPAGIYFAEVDNGNELEVIKLIKE